VNAIAAMHINPQTVEFRYYIFDWDNNILHMPTRIHLERLQEDGTWGDTTVSTSMFAIVRNDTENYRPPKGDWELAFQEFRDLEGLTDQQFLTDTHAALKPVIEGKSNPAPSFAAFRKALIEGRLFAIVTARGHHSHTIRQGVEYFIEQVLTDAERDLMMENLIAYLKLFGEHDSGMSNKQILTNYLALNRYIGITSEQFIHRHGDITRTLGQEEAKQVAIRDFVQHVIRILQKPEVPINRPISFGFSDDDSHNVEAVHAYIAEELAKEFPDIRFVVYDTSDPNVPEGRKIVVQGQLDLGL